MEKMKWHLTIFLIFTLILGNIAGCASIMTNPEKVVSITSTPLGANVYIDDIYMGQTPLLVKISRASTQPQPTIKLTKPGHRDIEGVIFQDKNGWTAGNIIPTLGLVAATVAIAENQSNETRYNYEGNPIGSPRGAVYFLGFFGVLIGGAIFWGEDQAYKYTYPSNLSYTLTPRPPMLKIQNETGFDIVLPKSILTRESDIVTIYTTLLDKETIIFNKASFDDAPDYLLHYTSGMRDYKREIKLQEDITLVLTKNDVAPFVTIRNETGNDIMQISVVSRQDTSSSITENDITYDILAPIEMLPNAKNIQFWLGRIPATLDNKYDLIYTDQYFYTYTKEDIIFSDAVTISLQEGGIPPSVMITNRTGFTINQIFLKPSNSNEWGFPIYSENISDTQSSPNIKILGYYASTDNKYDLRLDNLQNISYGMYNLDITEDITLEVTENNRPPMIRIINNIGTEADRVYIRHTGTTQWGFPISSDMFQNGDSKNIQIPFDKWGHNLRYDIRIDSSNGTLYRKANIQINAETTISFTENDKG